MRTRVGYAGGEHRDPTYHDLGDHIEAFQLDFDPTAISYDELLAMFWSSHKPDRPSYGRQYMAAVFAEPGEQESRARASASLIAAKLGRSLETPVIAGARFYLAEDYHQKYYLRHHPLMLELIAYSPRQLVDSTLAARLNGWIGTRQPDKAEAFLRGTARVSARVTR